MRDYKQKLRDQGAAAVHFVSFPRSGHHWLAQSLHLQFGEKLRLCEGYRCQDAFGYRLDCAYSGRRPALSCPNKALLIKNHDFNLAMEPEPDNRVLVLYRKEYVRSLRSWFRLDTGLDSHSFPLSFWVFALLRIPYFLGFKKRWVERRLPFSHLRVVYEDFGISDSVYSEVRQFVLDSREDESCDAIQDGRAGLDFTPVPHRDGALDFLLKVLTIALSPLPLFSLSWLNAICRRGWGAHRAVLPRSFRLGSVGD